MSYTAFAGIYDRMIAEDVDYGKICDFIENVFAERDIAPELIADIACGTGGVTIPLAERGYDMIGIDRSDAMLDVARRKDRGNGVLFINQPIERLDLYGTVGAAVCMTDGFNYVLSDKTLLEALKRFRTCFLDKGGVLIFDVRSDFCLRNTHADKTFVYDSDDIFYVWENKYLEKKHLCEMTVNFFKKSKNGYRRITETQIQRGRSEEELRTILERAGFVNITCYSDTAFSPTEKSSERLWFVCENSGEEKANGSALVAN